jgi:hypothetical protein
VSLVGFHRSLILVAIFFCFGYSAWELRAWLADGGGGPGVLAIVFALLGLALMVYLARLRTILRLRD